uniref:Zinc finger CCHC domain-containing protein 17 n=1 Tax=Strix occidentalis caurina TaxID=311401 RepID=A0A8D0FUW3_STROC
MADAGRPTNNPFPALLLKCPVTVEPILIKVFGRKRGLVHKTHMSSCRVDKPSEIVDVGDKVWVKLIGKEVKDDKLKLSLSMKVVNQGTGKDLDPNNVSLDQDERKKRTFRDYTSQKITLEAVLNTVCKKCGCKGMFVHLLPFPHFSMLFKPLHRHVSTNCHFAKECFVQPGGTKYSLIPEEEEEEVAAAGYERDKKTSMGDDSSKKRKKVRDFNSCAFSLYSCSTVFKMVLCYNAHSSKEISYSEKRNFFSCSL